jgi:hypothetical protein
MMFLETSALTVENVHEAFLKCTRTIFNRIENGEIDADRIGSGIQFGDISLRSNLQRSYKSRSNGATSLNNNNKSRISNCYLPTCN